MVAKIQYDILLHLAERIVTELYNAACKDPKIMVCDWRAYAILESYRQYAYLIDDVEVPSIESCFNGSETFPELETNKLWEQLTTWHRTHLRAYYEGDNNASYERYLNLPMLKLDSYTLRL